MIFLGGVPRRCHFIHNNSRSEKKSRDGNREDSVEILFDRLGGDFLGGTWVWIVDRLLLLENGQGDEQPKRDARHVCSLEI